MQSLRLHCQAPIFWFQRALPRSLATQKQLRHDPQPACLCATPRAAVTALHSWSVVVDAHEHRHFDVDPSSRLLAPVSRSHDLARIESDKVAKRSARQGDDWFHEHRLPLPGLGNYAQRQYDHRHALLRPRQRSVHVAGYACAGSGQSLRLQPLHVWLWKSVKIHRSQWA